MSPAGWVWLSYIFNGLLEGSRVVIHVITPEAQEAHEDQHEIPMKPHSGVTREEILQSILLLITPYREDGGGQLILTPLESIC